MKPLLPAVRAELAERYIFNFRMPPHAMKRYLPTPWLTPQTVHGDSIASFCLLDLRHITVAPLPCLVGLHSLSCAPRYAVLDTSGAMPTPAVFVTERLTSNAFGAWFTSLGFSCRHPYIQAGITHNGEKTAIEIQRPSHPFHFSASVSPAPQSRSTIFPNAEAFGAFVAQGVQSYGLSRYPGRLTKVDLHKEDFGYEPLQVLSLHSPLIEKWQRHGAVLDSAFRTAGGHYEWTYHGLTRKTECEAVQ